MSGEVLGGFGGRTRRIVRRGDHCHADVRSDANSDHVLRYLLAHAYAGVEALRDDVRETVVDDDFHLDVGIVGQESLESRLQHRYRGVLAGSDANRSGRSIAQFVQGGEFGFDLLKPRRHGAQQAFAGFGWSDTARGPGQEPQANPLL